MNATSIQNGGGLVVAAQELKAIVLQNCQDLEVILTSAQKCCSEIQHCFENTPENVPVKSVLDAILILKRAFSSIAGIATTAEQKLVSLKHDFWHQSLFPTLKDCCFSEKWHTPFIQSDFTSGHSLHASFQATVRDIIKEDLIPLIADGIASQSPEAGGLCLAYYLNFVLDLASTAAELIGWRDERVKTAPYLRNYGLVNALWLGVYKCWSAVPPSLRSQLVAQSKQHTKTTMLKPLSAEFVVERLLDFLRCDFYTLCSKKLAADVKLLQFWSVQISKMLAAYPETALPVWKAMKNWIPTARSIITKMETMEDASTVEFVRAVHEGSLWVRLARLQRQALGLLPATLQKSCIEEAKQEIHSLRVSDRSSAEELDLNKAQFVFAAVVELLGQAGSLPEASRCACFPLFKETMLCIPGASFAPALATAEVRQNTADSLLVFALSLASSASAAAVLADTGHAAQFQEAWEACQIFFMECSTIPHPYMLSIMSTIWSSLVSVSDGPTTKHFVAAMHDVLSATAAIEAGAAAAEGAFKPSSQTTQQLTQLLGVLLASVPQQMAESFCERFLKLDSNGAVDVCHLASLSAILRAASFSGRPASSTTLSNLTTELCQGIARALKVNPATQTSEQKIISTESKHHLPPNSSLCLYLAWAVDCLGASLENVESYLDCPEGNYPLAMEKLMQTVVKTCMTMLSSADAATSSYVPPTLHTLNLAWKLLPTSLNNTQLETLASCMERFLHAAPAAAAGIAELTPVLSLRPAPPKVLFDALLGPSQSASLHFLGREAYVKYAKECPDENVLGALPRQWLDPSGTKLSEQGQPVMEKYLSRGCSTAPGAVLTKNNGLLEKLIKKEMENLAREASSGLAMMKVKAMEVSSKMTIEQHQKVVKNTAVVMPPGEDSFNMECAALQVMKAVENLQKVWVPVAPTSSSDGAVKTVMQARDALAALLGQNQV